MNARRHLWFTSMVLALLAAGCAGGSGSSGFDIAENLAIDEALETQECVDFEGLTICPTGSEPSPAPSASPTPTATAIPPIPSITSTPPIDVPAETRSPTPPHINTPLPTSEPSVTPTSRPEDTTRPTPVDTPTVPTAGPVKMEIDTSLGEVGLIDCPAVPPGIPCVFSFRFTTRGFSPEAQYRVAVRNPDDGAWTILPATPIVSPSQDATFDSNVSIDRGAEPGSADSRQFAVLVYLTPRDDVPVNVEKLGDSGADFAYVTSAVEVSSTGQAR